MKTNCAVQDHYEISPRFCDIIMERITRLEHDARNDEAQIERLADPEHIQRQMRLVAVQRAEALRMRLFLNRARTRGEAAD